MLRISSRHNARFRNIARLIASSRERRKQGRCVIEGEHLITVYEQRYGAPETIVLSEDALDRDAMLALASRQHERSVVVPRSLFAELVASATDVGVLAVVPVPQSQPSISANFCLLLDDVQDPGNVGSMLRSAAGAGIQQVLLSRHCAFAWSPKVLRAGQGAHFLLDIHHDVDLVAWSDRFRDRGEIVVAAASDADDLYRTALSEPLAIVIGNEGAGVSSQLAAQATRRVTIPMPGGMESLNAAAAAAVILFECVRQRRGSRGLHGK
jgi:TrmH family RNA methyltransferase